MVGGGERRKGDFVVLGALASLFHDQSHYNLFHYDLFPFISNAQQSPLLKNLVKWNDICTVKIMMGKGKSSEVICKI